MKIKSVLLSSIPRLFSVMCRRNTTVGLIIIGNEILNGRIVDTNSSFALKYFFKWNIVVKRVSVIPDEVDEICKEVKECSHLYDYVVTTGGIGPTADDVTYLGIAQAFQTNLKLNEKFFNIIEETFGKKESSSNNFALAKVATIPDNAKLLWIDNIPGAGYPIVTVENVFILPGVPQIFERVFPFIRNFITPSQSTASPPMSLHSRVVYLRPSELEIADKINAVFDKFTSNGNAQNVQLGSYPQFDNNYYKTKLTIDTHDKNAIDQVYNFIKCSLPEGSIHEDYIEDVVSFLPESVYSFNPTLISADFGRSLDSIEKALRDYSPDNVVLSFNGGKDCTVLLHLYAAVLKKHYATDDVDKRPKINLLFIETGESFQEMTRFINDTMVRYNVGDFHHIKCNSILEGLKSLNKQKPNISAILMGTRRSDPNGANSDVFHKCDPQYGSFMRVNAIIDWSYSDVWTFIRTLQVPYCVLYDQGYTSLGCKEKTRKNPLLFVERRGKLDVFKPAYTLVQTETERFSRID